MKLLYIITILCLNDTLPYVNVMDVILGDIHIERVARNQVSAKCFMDTAQVHFPWQAFQGVFQASSMTERHYPWCHCSRVCGCEKAYGHIRFGNKLGCMQEPLHTAPCSWVTRYRSTSRRWCNLPCWRDRDGLPWNQCVFKSGGAWSGPFVFAPMIFKTMAAFLGISRQKRVAERF